WKTWTRRGALTYHHSAETSGSTLVATDAFSLEYNLIEQNRVWLLVEITYESAGDGNSLLLRGYDTRPTFIQPVQRMPLPLSMTEKPTQTRIPIGRYEGLPVINLTFRTIDDQPIN